MIHTIVIATVLVLLGSTDNAIGGVVFSFTGTVTRVDDPLGMFADAKAGDSVSGYFLYSTEADDWSFVGTSDEYRNFQTTDPDLGKWDALVSVTTDSTVITNKDPSEPRHLFGVQLRNDPATGASVDSLTILAYHGNIFENVPLVTEIGIGFTGNDVFEAATPPTVINFENADHALGQFAFLGDTNGDGSRESRSFVEFRVDSLDTAPVPEPTSIVAWLLVMSLAVVFSKPMRSIGRIKTVR
jgi:hypothetical protein